jgi:hypothetical protein
VKLDEDLAAVAAFTEADQFADVRRHVDPEWIRDALEATCRAWVDDRSFGRVWSARRRAKRNRAAKEAGLRPLPAAGTRLAPDSAAAPAR